jgi:hypothetical protein
MMKKAMDWLRLTGVSNVAYLGIGIVSTILGYTLVAGAAYGIFTYINFNVISKIVRDKITSGD